MISKQLIKALEYIESNLDEPLTTEQLSQQACQSRYHFHRQFAACTGLTVAHYVKQLRFKRASYALRYRANQSILDIALIAGFQSTEGFSRAFKQFSGYSPSEFRQRQLSLQYDTIQTAELLRTKMMEQQPQNYRVDIVDFNAVDIALLVHQGSPNQLPSSIGRFIEWRKANKLPPAKSRTFNLLFDDPSQTPPDEFRFGLGAQVKPEMDIESADLSKSQIPSGKCALLKYTGIEAGLESAINYLYAVWLEENQQTLRDFPIFLERVRFFPDCAENQAETHIYLPLS